MLYYAYKPYRDVLVDVNEQLCTTWKIQENTFVCRTISHTMLSLIPSTVGRYLWQEFVCLFMCVCGRSKEHRKLIVPENSFPVIFRSVEPVYDRESGAEPVEEVQVSYPHFRRGKNSENWFVRKLFLQRGEQLGRKIMIIHFNLLSCRCQQQKTLHLQITIGSCQDD